MPEKDRQTDLKGRIRQQMEFYFSDSNLSKDKFLRQEIKVAPEGYVDLNVFLKFNKIRQLTGDLVLIAKALKKSELLEVNQEKSHVRRKSEFVEPSQKKTDKKTIYVENLPAKVTNDSLKKHFENQFGKVCYISMPKFKTSFQLKGFAFVEFEEKACAKEAVKFYENDENTAEIVGKFPKSHKIKTDLEKKILKVKESLSYYADQNEDTKAENTLTKRKASEVDESEVSVIKKAKPNTEANKTGFENLQVVSKKKWLRLKEEFLTRQKEEIANLRALLAKLNEELQEKLSAKYKSKHASIKTDDIVKGCVIKLTLSPDDADFDSTFKLSRQAFKNKYLKNDLDGVAYVDVEKNCNKVLIRCKSSDSARELMNKSDVLEKFHKSLLGGIEEIEYFEKIYSNREKKLNKKDRRKDSDLIREAIGGQKQANGSQVAGASS